MNKSPKTRRNLGAKRASPKRASSTPLLDITPFVVVVCFPSSLKEYHYLCKDPSIRQGSWVIANGTEVQVIRTLAVSDQATKYVQTKTEYNTARRRTFIEGRIAEIEREFLKMDRYRALAKRSPEVRRLLKELESL